MAKEQGHFGRKALDELHKPVAGKGGKSIGAAGCLTGHLYDFKKFQNQISCNYRWQCYESNKGNGSIKTRLHTYVSRFPGQSVKTDTRSITNMKDWLKEYYSSLPKPQMGDWHIGGPWRTIKRDTFSGPKTTIRKGHNFTHALWPYYNNAHHIIPKGTLQARITETRAPASNIIQQALLKAKYNVNHGHNMIFLPMDKRVGSIVRLPRHLTTRGLRSHPEYDAFVVYEAAQKKVEAMEELNLREIMDEYKAAAQKAKPGKKQHDIPNAKLSKTRLQDLSEQLLELILEWGAAGTGESLDEETRP